MAREPTSEEQIHRVADVLDELGVQYAFMGGTAVNAWAIPRSTYDLDLNLTCEPARLQDVLRRFEGEGFLVDEPYLKGYLDHLAGFPKLNVQMPIGPAMTTLDIFVTGTAFQESVMQRRTRVRFGSHEIWVVSAADLLLFKLLAWRRKDRLDVDNLVTIQGFPEPAYLKHWANALGVGERLEEIRRESGGQS